LGNGGIALMTSVSRRVPLVRTDADVPHREPQSLARDLAEATMRRRLLERMLVPVVDSGEFFGSIAPPLRAKIDRTALSSLSPHWISVP
jgi:hypothetical protein